MNFNMDLLLKIYRVRERGEQYCFALNMFLGKNGLFEYHILKGRKFIRIEDDV